MPDRVGELRERIASRFGVSDRLQPPSGRTPWSSWRRAQTAPPHAGPTNLAELGVLLGRGEHETALSRRPMLFAVYRGRCAAERDRDAHRFR